MALGEKELKVGLFKDQIWLIAVCLMIVSLAIVFSSSEMLAYRKAGGNTWHYLVQQAKHMVVGIGCMLVFQLCPPRLFYRYSYIALFVMVVLLVLTVAMGTTFNQARRALDIFGKSVQTLELARIPLILFLASWFAGHQREIGDFRRGVLPPLIVTGVVCGLILTGGLSLTILAGTTAFSLFLVGNVRWRHILLIVVMGVAMLGMAILILPHVTSRARNATWASRLENFMGKGDGQGNEQAHQAQIAIAGGKLFGKGPGAGTQRFSLPNPQDDFVFASLVEEYGMLLGGLGVMSLYIWLLWRVRVLIKRSQKLFHTYLVAGVGFMMGFQALWHMSISVGLSPTTGITLPLVSLGGTSVVATCMGLGLLLSVSRWQRKAALEEQRLQAQGEGVPQQG